MNRRGFTLVELLVGTVVMAILGTILARMLIQDSRFVSQLEAMMDARQSARAAMNSMAVELRMVSQGGLVNASSTMLEVRTPYAWGVACDRDGGDIIASLVPADSMWYASASADGVAWLAPSGNYQFETGVSVSSSGASSECTSEGVQVLPGGQLVAIDMVATPAPGSVLYLYQEVRYSFAPSGVPSLSGRTALWRRAGTGPNEEILAPFDSTAGFGFFVDPSAPPQPSPPFDLSTVTGVELRLHGESELTPEGQSQPQDFQLQTRVTFLNTSS